MIDLFGRQKQCLRLMGHHFVRDKSQLLQKWHSFIYFAVLMLVASAQWPMMNYIIYYIDNLEYVTASLSISFTNILTVIKITTFLTYKWRFVALMSKLETMYQKGTANLACLLHFIVATWPNETAVLHLLYLQDLQRKVNTTIMTDFFFIYDFFCAAVTEPDSKQLLQTANRNALNMVKLYWISVCSTGSYFMLAPLLKIILSKIRNTKLVLELPMPMRFYFDAESSPGYEFGYGYTGIVTLAVVMYAVATDGLFVSFAINLVAHFQILQNAIKSNTFLKSDKEQHHEIKCYIEYHNLILNLYNELRDIYSPIVFGQFLMTSLQVCVIIYQMVKHIDTVLILIINCTFLTSILLQLFIYCYGGEILKLESLMVGVSVQLSNWYNLKPSHRRMLALVMLRSQREAIIKAGFYEASLANFMTILKAALSYITLIQSIE